MRRAEALRFFGGFIAFPGGRVSPSGGATTIDVSVDTMSEAYRNR